MSSRKTDSHTLTYRAWRLVTWWIALATLWTFLAGVYAVALHWTWASAAAGAAFGGELVAMRSAVRTLRAVGKMEAGFIAAAAAAAGQLERARQAMMN